MSSDVWQELPWAVKVKAPGGPEKEDGVTRSCGAPKHCSTGVVLGQAKTVPETCWRLPVTASANGNTWPLATLVGAFVVQVAVTSLRTLRVTGTAAELLTP